MWRHMGYDNEIKRVAPTLLTPTILCGSEPPRHLFLRVVWIAASYQIKLKALYILAHMIEPESRFQACDFFSLSRFFCSSKSEKEWYCLHIYALKIYTYLFCVGLIIVFAASPPSFSFLHLLSSSVVISTGLTAPATFSWSTGTSLFLLRRTPGQEPATGMVCLLSCLLSAASGEPSRKEPGSIYLCILTSGTWLD